MGLKYSEFRKFKSKAFLDVLRSLMKSQISIINLHMTCCNFCVKTSSRFCFFFYQGFLSRTLTTHRTAGEGRGPSFIPLYHFHPLTNVETFAILHVRWLSRIFNRNACIYQTATRWDVPPYRITIWLIDDVTLSFLFVCVMIWF